MGCSCHIQSALIDIEYQNWSQTLDVYLLFAILPRQIYKKKLNYRQFISYNISYEHVNQF